MWDSPHTHEPRPFDIIQINPGEKIIYRHQQPVIDYDLLAKKVADELAKRGAASVPKAETNQQVDGVAKKYMDKWSDHAEKQFQDKLRHMDQEVVDGYAKWLKEWGFTCK